MLPNTIPPANVTGIDADTLAVVLAEMTELKIGDDMALSEVLASLAQRGFLNTSYELPYEQAGVEEQIFAVTEEIGEMSRHMRRVRQDVLEYDVESMALEAADVFIAACNLLRRAAGVRAAEIVRQKMAADELRGWRHQHS